MISLQDLFLDVLSSTATKREARSYLSHFGLPKPPLTRIQRKPLPKPDCKGVNLGNLYLPLRAVDQSPVFGQGRSQDGLIDQATKSLHVALVKIRAPQSVDDEVLRGVGHTLSQLTRLGMSCVIIVDCQESQERGATDDSRVAIEQADRVVAAIDRYGGQGARRLDGVIGVSSIEEQHAHSVKVRGGVHVAHRNLLLTPLRRGVIPVIMPIGFVSDTQTLSHVLASDVLLALTREFAGIQPLTYSDEDDPLQVAENMKRLQREFSLDRIILLDPLGGIPSSDEAYGSHVFVNLEQEFERIKSELLSWVGDMKDQKAAHVLIQEFGSETFSFRGPLLEPSADQNSALTKKENVNCASIKCHLRNLELLKDALAILPPSSSALLTTPQAAANLAIISEQSSTVPGVGTRRQRNPLIHNLLTDKPVFSPSLPPDRTRNASPNPFSIASPVTFVKRGMPLSIIPNPLTDPWNPHTSASSPLHLSDPRIDLPRLVHLIEDSFGRKLDVQHYLSRIDSHIAGIIIAGEYEGGALLTWETPPSPDDDDEGVRPPVPYLDKFAVLKRSQGAGGVADMLFNAMVRDCFPHGVCWRSRKTNPVNKWYFERAKGSWKMPDTQWTMFWTTAGVQLDGALFRDYERVCRGVLPSWADDTGVVD